MKNKGKIENLIYEYVSTHEVILTNKIHNRNLLNSGILLLVNVYLMWWVCVCDDETRAKILKMMNNKRAINE